MITRVVNHTQFIEAIRKQAKVIVRFCSEDGDQVFDRVCAPIDYGTGDEPQQGLERYWLWDFAHTSHSHILGLLPDQIIELRTLGERFDPAKLDISESRWSIACLRNEGLTA